MADPTTIGEAIEQVGLSPKRTKVKSTEIEEHDLDSLIRADNHVAAKTAGRRNHLGLRFAQIIPPGAG
jgi:hypothetical protein